MIEFLKEKLGINFIKEKFRVLELIKNKLFTSQEVIFNNLKRIEKKSEQNHFYIKDKLKSLQNQSLESQGFLNSQVDSFNEKVESISSKLDKIEKSLINIEKELKVTGNIKKSLSNTDSKLNNIINTQNSLKKSILNKEELNIPEFLNSLDLIRSNQTLTLNRLDVLEARELNIIDNLKEIKELVNTQEVDKEVNLDELNPWSIQYHQENLNRLKLTIKRIPSNYTVLKPLYKKVGSGLKNRHCYDNSLQFAKDRGEQLWIGLIYMNEEYFLHAWNVTEDYKIADYTLGDIAGRVYIGRRLSPINDLTPILLEETLRKETL